MYQVRPDPPLSSEPSSATIASSGNAQRIADTMAFSDSRSASETRSVWLDFASTPVGAPSKPSSRCRPAARAASIATVIGSAISVVVIRGAHRTPPLPSRRGEPTFDSRAHRRVRRDVRTDDVHLAVPVYDTLSFREAG